MVPPQIAERSFEDEYDRALCLLPQQHHGVEVKKRFLQRLAFRSGIKRPAA